VFQKEEEALSTYPFEEPLAKQPLFFTKRKRGSWKRVTGSSLPFGSSKEKGNPSLNTSIAQIL